MPPCTLTGKLSRAACVQYGPPVLVASTEQIHTAQRSSTAPPRRRAFALVVGLFVASGSAGLIDQICFSKYLSYIVGSTAHAVSAVLAAFMLGMALGNHLGGRWCAKVEKPLLAYGLLELVVAVTAALTPLAFAALTPGYVALIRLAPDSLMLASAVRWTLAMLVVIVPTTAMGATLPLLSRLIDLDGQGDRDAERTTERARERRLGTLYAANTLGGALGALGSAYLILPMLGLRSTIWLAAAVSAMVGVTAILLGRHAVSRANVQEKSEPKEAALSPSDGTSLSPSDGTSLSPSDGISRAAWRLLAGFALLSGALVFAAEVISTHLLALLIGNSAFAFGLILAIFLVCLFAGASVAPLAHRRLGARALPLGLATTGLAIAATLGMWDQLPEFFAGMGDDVATFQGRELVRAAAAFSVLVVPTTLMGLTFPLVLQRVANVPNVGRLVGRLTAINTIGAVVGSLATGYLLLPALGSQGSLRALAIAFAAAGLVAVLARRDESRLGRSLGAAVAIAGLALAVLSPPWDLARLTSGNNVYFTHYDPPDEIVEIREDVQGGVTTVAKKNGVTTLYTNGKFQGNNGAEMSAQRFFAHYPGLFVNGYKRALAIGLGTGTTVGTLTAYPYEKIDVVEISPAIVSAAERYFSGPNRNALRDPRVSLSMADGRNFLLMSEHRYDLIGIELTSIWFAGAASLYSREFYALVAEHLTPDGILQQWVQLHHMSPRDFATLLSTLHMEFEHVALFYGGGQGILVASHAPLSADMAKLEQLQSTPSMREVLPADRPFRTLFRDVLLAGVGVDHFLADTANELGISQAELVSNDDNLYLEYATPRSNVLPWSAREKLISKIAKHRDGAMIDALVASRATP